MHIEFAPARRWHVFRVPAGLQTKADLLAALRQLPLPKYAADNFDALDEVLCDLSFIEADVVRIEHEDLPGLPREELETYLEILADAIEARAEGGPVLQVSFPPGAQATVQRLLI